VTLSTHCQKEAVNIRVANSLIAQTRQQRRFQIKKDILKQNFDLF